MNTNIEFDRTDLKLIVKVVNDIINILNRHKPEHTERILETIIGIIKKSINGETK